MKLILLIFCVLSSVKFPFASSCRSDESEIYEVLESSESDESSEKEYESLSEESPEVDEPYYEFTDPEVRNVTEIEVPESEEFYLS